MKDPLIASGFNQSILKTDTIFFVQTEEYGMIRRFCIAAIGCLLAGCAQESAGPATRTEALRASLDMHVQRFMLQAEAAWRKGHYVHALALTDSVAHYVPELADTYFLRGRIYTDLNQLDAANAAYARVLAADEAYRGAHMNIGINYFRRGRLRDAIGAFRREEAIEPNTHLYQEMGRTYAKLGLADSAQWSYEQALAIDSMNTTAHMWLGQLHEEMGDFEAAIALSRRAAEIRPESVDYRYVLGTQLLYAGEVEEAVVQLRTVVEERPSHHGAQYNLGQALMRLGEETEAEVHLGMVEETQQIQQEINEASDAINRNPSDLNNWLRLSDAHRKAGMYDRALDAYKRAIAIVPNDLRLHVNLATLMLESGDTDAAITQYRMIVDRDSAFVEAWLNLGVAYGNAGRHDEARQSWEMALRLDPGSRAARNYLNQLARMAGEG